MGLPPQTIEMLRGQSAASATKETNMTKTILKIAAAAGAIALFSSAPQAADSLSLTIGLDLINLGGTYTNGNYTNIGANNGFIDGGVTITAGPGTIIAPVKLNAHEESTALLSSSLSDTETLGAAAALLGGKISIAGVSTKAIGATVDGKISAGNHTETSNADNSVSDTSSSSSHTANTGAAAASSLITTDTLDTSVGGALVDVYASNIAYNNASINGSVSIIGADIGSTGLISTVVLGAGATGTISIGN